jgi:hypothetical protein
VQFGRNGAETGSHPRPPDLRQLSAARRTRTRRGGHPEDMNTTTRIVTAAAATVAGAALSLMAAGAPASAAPATGPTPTSACQSIGGSYAEYAGDWYCTHPAAAGMDAAVLTAVCWGEYSSAIIDDGNPDGTISFTCYSF